jgi:murein tripeptide amidase MpaA
MLSIVKRVEGSNPAEASAIDQVGEATFRIRPFSEDGDGNYKFALLVPVRNRGAADVTAEFVIDWQDAEYMSCRDYVLLGRAERWQWFPARCEGTVSTAKVLVPPGRWDLALHPTYGLARAARWTRRAGLRAVELGRSREGRPLVALEGGAGAGRRLAVVARTHPYETAGSFLAEGALRALAALAGKPGAPRFSVVLVANPDGVAHGLCKRTAAGGVDLSHQARSSDDPAAAALRRWVEAFRPEVLIDFHGWMHGYEDGFSYTDAPLAAHVKQCLRACADANRAWRGRLMPREPAPDTLWEHALAHAGTPSLVISIGWNGRTTAQMRRLGAAFAAACVSARAG